MNVLCWLLMLLSVGRTSGRSTASRKPQYAVHTLKLRTALEKKLQLVSNAAFGCVPTHHPLLNFKIFHDFCLSNSELLYKSF